MNDLILSNLKTPGTELGRVPLAHGSGFPAACLNTYVTKVGGVIETTILIDLAQGSGGGGTAGDIIGTYEDVANPAYIAQLDDVINGVVFACRVSCIELPTGGDPDINVTFSATDDDVHDSAVSSGTILVDEGDLTLGQNAVTAIGATTIAAGTNAKPYVYLVNGVATDAAYTAGKVILTFYGASF